jgi:hypothetical protein
VAAAALAGRRFGPRVGGWLIGFPVVAGPVLWFYAREQGQPFAARAAAGTLLGVVSLCGFLVAYVWAARRWDWARSLLAGYAAFTALTLLVMTAPGLAAVPWPAGVLLAFAALTLTLRVLPRILPVPPPRPRRDLLARLLATCLLVVTLTGLAGVLGPALSGLVTPFPVATTILVVFAHRESGAAGVLAVYGGYIPSLYSFAAFCAALAFALGRWPLAAGFGFALLVSLISQTIVLKGLTRAVQYPRSRAANPRDWRAPSPPA